MLDQAFSDQLPESVQDRGARAAEPFGQFCRGHLAALLDEFEQPLESGR